ncbi:MAG: type II 3-dehydroquinate dehydratase [Chlorobi bacterium]|nr:type II 3-dehydroquinate dehydratase [Chlorobiota bacterium]
MKIAIVNGPNLNLLGHRQPDIYGKVTFEDYLKVLQELFSGFTFTLFQSNREGELVDLIQSAEGKYDGIVLNAGAFTHTSVAIADAVASVSLPVIEVHISNILAREAFRQRSLLAKVCRGTITGFGMDGYRLAVEALRVISGKGNKPEE